METIEKKGSNKKIAIITSIIVALIIAIVAGTFMVQATPANKVKKQLQLAEKYLDELDYDKALAAYNEAIQIDPRNADAYLGLVEVYIRQNQHDKALEVAKKGHEATGDKRLRLKMEELLGLSGDQSMTPIQKQLKQAGEYLDALEYEKAQEIYEEILKNDPRNADAYLGLVEVYIRQNQYDKALEIAQKGYEATSDERLNEKIKMLQSGNVKDSRNNVMKTSYYDGAGNLVACHEYTYNEDNKRASIKATFTDGREPQIINYEYDSDGNSLVGCGYFGKSYRIFLIRYEYSNGKKVKNVHYEDTTMNEISSTSTYEYENDLLKTETRYNKDGEISSTSTYEYENDLLKTETHYNKDGKVTTQYEYTYDSNGKRTRYETYKMPEHTLTRYYIYEYDGEGKMVKFSHFKADGSLESYEIYEGSVTKTYDASGKLVSERRKD